MIDQTAETIDAVAQFRLRALRASSAARRACVVPRRRAARRARVPARRARLRPAGRHHLRRLPELPRRRRTASGWSTCWPTRETERAAHGARVRQRAGADRALGRAAVGRAPTGWSARCGTCSASASTGIPTCGGSCCPRSSRPIRCARTTRCKAAASGTTFPVLHGRGQS